MTKPSDSLRTSFFVLAIVFVLALCVGGYVLGRSAASTPSEADAARTEANDASFEQASHDSYKSSHADGFKKGLRIGVAKGRRAGRRAGAKKGQAVAAANAPAPTTGTSSPAEPYIPPPGTYQPGPGGTPDPDQPPCGVVQCE